MGSYYLKEDARRNEGLKIINNILTSRSDAGDIPPLAASSILNYRSDGHMVGSHGGAVCVTEFKNEIHGISSVPYVEATTYAAQTHTAMIPALSQGWRLPCRDLQDTNIICDDDWFFLIDFDWGGKLGDACYPVKFYELNPELVQGRSSNNMLITAEDDDRVLETTMNKVENRLLISRNECGDIPS